MNRSTACNSAGLRPLSTIEDLHGLALTFAYNGSNQLATVTEPGGNVYSFAYSGGQIDTITRPGNLTTTLTVDGSGDLTVIENADGGLRSFVYDGEHKMTRDDYGPLTTTVSYDAASDTVDGATQGELDPWEIVPRLVQGLDTDLNTTALDRAVVTDPRNFVTTYTLNNSFGQALKIETPDGNDQEWSYNADGQVTSYADPRDNTTSYGYSGGNLTSVTDALNNISTYTYTALNRVATQEDPLGNVTSYSYDNQTGDLLNIIDALGNTTTQTWSNGLLQTIEDANNNVTSFAYTAARQLEAIEDALNGKVTYGYSERGDSNPADDVLCR